MYQKKQKIGLIGFAAAVFVISMCFAQFWNSAIAASSENYQIQKDSLNFGGGHSSSTTYTAEDTFGEPATGEDLSSENYGACSGFQCLGDPFYLSFSVKEGTSSPGTTGAGVDLGLLDIGTVVTSDGSTVNSIFITADSSAANGVAVTVRDAYGGLARQSAPSQKIVSATETLTAGDEGFGLCIFSVTEDATSRTSFSAVSPYSSSCNKSDQHSVGLVDTTDRVILQSTGAMRGGDAEVLVKSAVGPTSAAGDDYVDTLTFIASSTY